MNADLKLVLVCLGGLVATPILWAWLLLWWSKRKDSSEEEVGEYVEENGIGETENDVRQYRKTNGL